MRCIISFGPYDVSRKYSISGIFTETYWSNLVRFRLRIGGSSLLDRDVHVEAESVARLI